MPMLTRSRAMWEATQRDARARERRLDGPLASFSPVASSASPPPTHPRVRAPRSRRFSVAFDPLDGSSIFGANFAVGSIFGLWPGDDLRGTGRDQVAACYAVYGPRTLLVIARPVVAADGLPPSRTTVVQEFELDPQQRAWRLNRANVRIGERRVFAPANLRAAADNPRYKALVGEWIESQYSLRYSGGMVPDVHHILCKGGGVFCNPESPGAPAKLRLLFECAPLSLIVEAAGGASTAGEKDLLDLAVGDHNQRTTICLGSPLEVQRCKRILWGDSSA